MSAAQELIAAALTAADELDELSKPMHGRMSPHAAALREACARAMVPPEPDAAKMVGAAPQTVSTTEVPMPGESILKIRALDSAEVRWIGREELHAYGDAREAAGYAAGVAAVGWRDVANELPKEAQEVLFVRGGKTIHGAWIGGIFWHNNQKMAAAKWMPLPAPQTEAALRGEVK